ncbi:MAG: hypothetical protein HRT47_11835 [Candidatus Caenarcaniphilales bacterium]|nr:hypothetical protein [Candidatus Caenarcaniphilales bacterium]
MSGENLPATLEEINFNNNFFNEFENIQFPPGLKKPSLEFNNIDGDKFADLVLPEGLEELSLSHNLLFNPKASNSPFQFPDALENLSLPDSIKILDLSDNSLNNLDNLDVPASLEVLKLKENFFSRKEKRRIRKRFKALGVKVRI